MLNESRASHSAPVVTPPWTDITQKGSHDSYSKATPRQSFTAGFSPPQASPQKCRWSISKLIISWFFYTAALSRGTLLIPHKNRAKHNSCPADRDSTGMPREEQLCCHHIGIFKLEDLLIKKVLILLTVACCLSSLASLDVLCLNFNKRVKKISIFTLNLIFKTF